MAARDLAVGTLIRDADLKTAAWFGPPPAGAILKRDALLNRGVVSAIYEGELVTENRLAPIGSGGGLAATIPPGMRACAVKVNEVVGVAGFVVPGMRVDVLITGLPPGGNALDGPKVRTLLQNIQVLSAGVNFQKDRKASRNRRRLSICWSRRPKRRFSASPATKRIFNWCCGIPWILRSPGCRVPSCRIFSAVRAPRRRLHPSAQRAPPPAMPPAAPVQPGRTGRTQSVHHRSVERLRAYPSHVQPAWREAMRTAQWYGVAMMRAACLLALSFAERRRRPTDGGPASGSARAPGAVGPGFAGRSLADCWKVRDHR